MKLCWEVMGGALGSCVRGLLTESPYIQKSNSLCTRTEHHMLLPIILHMVVPLC